MRYFCEETTCDVNIANGQGQNVLHIACGNNCLVLVSYLIEEQKIDREMRDKNLNLDIHVASIQGNTDIVRYLIEKQHVDVNVAANKVTPLHIACKNGHLNLGEYLINEAKANQLLKDEDGHFGHSITRLERLDSDCELSD